MQKTRLKQYTPLRRFTPLRSYKPLNKISAKQRKELVLRRKVRKELVTESNGYCPECGRRLDWHWTGFDMSHEKPLSHGGKTDKKNGKLLCHFCHLNERHGERLKYD